MWLIIKHWWLKCDFIFDTNHLFIFLVLFALFVAVPKLYVENKRFPILDKMYRFVSKVP